MTFTDYHSIVNEYDGGSRLMSSSLFAVPLAEAIPPFVPGPCVGAEPILVRRKVYAGEHLIVNDSVAMTFLPGDAGFIDADNNVYYWLKDFQGNNIILADALGCLVDTIAYYPYGQPIVYPVRNPAHTPAGSVIASKAYLYSGKEYIRDGGFNSYDFGARFLASGFPVWNRLDPLCEKTYGIAPYTFCAANPVMFFDPDGLRTYVECGDTRFEYKIVGGELDNDLNIYVVTQIEEGIFEESNSIIGVTTSKTSFYNSDTEEWAVGNIIDLSDTSGEIFLKNLMENTPDLKEYILNARNGYRYDFKSTNGSNSKDDGLLHYRGMPIGSINGKKIITSARDIGNIGAGYITGINGIPWAFTRIAFDIYQGGIEGDSSQNAQKLGWNIGFNKSNLINRSINLIFTGILPVTIIW